MSFLADLQKFGGGLMRRKLADMQAAWNGGSQAEKAAFQSSVSGDRALLNASQRDQQAAGATTALLSVDKSSLLDPSGGASIRIRPPSVVFNYHPYLRAPSGTFTDATGAFTFGTALAAVPNGATPSGGNCYMHLPAGAGGLAGGWYEAVIVTVTAGYLVGLPTTTATAWTATTAYIPAFALTVPAGALGPNGNLVLDGQSNNNATAGLKTVFYNIAGATNGNWATAQNATVTSARVLARLNNRGAQNRQFIGSRIGYPGLGTAAVVPYFSINTADAWEITIGLQCTVATDWLMFEGACATGTYVG